MTDTGRTIYGGGGGGGGATLLSVMPAEMMVTWETPITIASGGFKHPDQLGAYTEYPTGDQSWFDEVFPPGQADLGVTIPGIYVVGFQAQLSTAPNDTTSRVVFEQIQAPGMNFKVSHAVFFGARSYIEGGTLMYLRPESDVLGPSFEIYGKAGATTDLTYFAAGISPVALES